MNTILQALHNHLQQHYPNHNIVYHHTNTLIVIHESTTLLITQQNDTLHLNGHKHPKTTISLHDPEFLQKIHHTIQHQ